MADPNPQLITSEGWAAIGATVREIVDGHFARGVGPTGKPLAPYSADYAEERAEAGDSARPDMQKTGQFRRSIRAMPREDGVSVGPVGGTVEQTKGWGRANVKRPVVALGKKEVDRVMGVVMSEVDAALKGIVDG